MPRLQGISGKAFNYAHNPLSVLGAVLATVAALSIAACLAVEATVGLANPYIGLFAYLVLPGLLLVGLVLMPAGMAWRRRRLQRHGASEEARRRYPRLDFNDPRLRRLASGVLALTAVNAVLFGLASVLAVEHMESTEFCGSACHVMEPQRVAHAVSPHSRVACVDCHVGPGAAGFVQAKVGGTVQLWKTLRGTYERPITQDRQARLSTTDTCGGCHDPERRLGQQLELLVRHAGDRHNTPSYSVLLSDPDRVHDVHGRTVRLRYVEGDGGEILWVEASASDGEIRAYSREGQELPPRDELERRAADFSCLGCHSRTAHRFEVPSLALDALLADEPDLVALPFFKREALRLVESAQTAASRQEGMETVRRGVLAFYRQQHPEAWSDDRPLVARGADEAASLFGASVFPALATDWNSHPDHLGHEESPGCFRCHDEELTSAGGDRVISMDCESCHVFLAEDAAEPPDLALLAGAS